MNKICFIICWFGKLPEYLPIWMKSCAYNPEMDFLLITDDHEKRDYPPNIKYIPFSSVLFRNRVEERLTKRPSIEAAYRLCDFRPMYGIIFREELSGYDYWGYCDLDLVFGCIRDFLPLEEIYKYEAIFNGGHFSLVRNNDKMNNLHKCQGAIFDYQTVMEKNAVFAFDETTGFQRIARANNIKAKFGVPYIETEIKYRQLRSRLEETNPQYQAFYWEKGALFRVKADQKKIRYQKFAYIHLQKRTIRMLEDGVADSMAFWITPDGYSIKAYSGLPTKEDIQKNNPYEGEAALAKQALEYRNRKIVQILKRTPFQIYVRLKQQKAGINAGDGSKKERKWLE